MPAGFATVRGALRSHSFGNSGRNDSMTFVLAADMAGLLWINPARMKPVQSIGECGELVYRQRFSSSGRINRRCGEGIGKLGEGKGFVAQRIDQRFSPMCEGGADDFDEERFHRS